MSKRANSEGSIFKRTDGRWCATISGDQGQRKYFYGKTRQEVGQKLASALKARQDGLPFVGERQSVAAYLAEWLETCRSSVRPRTWQRYEQYVRVHAVPGIGKIPLARLAPHHLQKLYAKTLEGGSSETTTRHLHMVLHRALGQATRWGLVGRNVADLVTPPRKNHHEMMTLSPEQSRSFLAATKGDRLHALYVLAITTGMRQGELLGLRWRDVDLEDGSVQVRGSLQRTSDGLTIAEPKTTRSRRKVALADAAIEALRRNRVVQAEERLRLGAAWEDNDLVFANERGRPLEARNLLRRSFVPLLKRAGLPAIRFHDLRHTAATLMLGKSVHPKVVAEMLGHSQIAVTLDLYSHVTPTMQGQAAQAMNAILGSTR